MTVGDHRQAQKIGTLNYNANSNKYSDWSTSNLPAVNDPSQAYANIIKGESADYMKDYGAFEEALIAARKDTSLIDAVPEQIETQTRLSGEIAERNRARYGYTRTAAEQSEAGRSLQRQGNLGLAGGLTNARIAQKEQNYQTMAGLINIGADSYSQNINALSSASAGHVERMNAYKMAKAQHKSNMIGTVASLGSAAIMGAFFL
jgi:hypothetical protein